MLDAFCGIYLATPCYCPGEKWQLWVAAYSRPSCTRSAAVTRFYSIFLGVRPLISMSYIHTLQMTPTNPASGSVSTMGWKCRVSFSTLCWTHCDENILFWVTMVKASSPSLSISICQKHWNRTKVAKQLVPANNGEACSRLSYGHGTDSTYWLTAL